MAKQQKIKIRHLIGAAGPGGTVINAGDEEEVDNDLALRLLNEGRAEAIGGKVPAKRAEQRDGSAKKPAAKKPAEKAEKATGDGQARMAAEATK
ncbi:MAG TPA: hypothetical protein VMF31_10605 [Solirubrobacterales bacterium]|nr:hypothetical protein [Solirubrobacterales bacterium]